jgi:hypothetical protein
MADATEPLPPMTPEFAGHLTATLGAPGSVVKKSGFSIRGWVVGRGETRAQPPEPRTTVIIGLTVDGDLFTTREEWTESEDSFAFQDHMTPALAYQWLVEKDGTGQLEPASKEAWVQACRNVPAMSGLESEIG